MRLYKEGITMTVTAPSEIQRYKDAGYVEVTGTELPAAPVEQEPVEQVKPPKRGEQ